MIRALTLRYWARHARNNGLPRVREALEDFRALSPGAQRRELGRRLLEQVRFFGGLEGALPAWQALAREGDPEVVLAAWHELPILTKAEQRERFPLDAIQDRLGAGSVLNSTGGSTGEPTFFIHDQAAAASALALQTLHWQRMGWRPGLPVLSLWGAQRDIGAGAVGWTALKLRLSAFLYGIHVVAGFAITEAAALGALDWLEAHGPAAVYGYTSLLDFLARTALDHGRKVPAGLVAVAWNGGECLFPDQCARFERVFGVPILNYYAGRELGVLGCQLRPGGPLEIPRPFIHVEVVDAEGRPAAPGVEGRLIVTSTLGRGTPFLRYEVGDLGSYGSAHRDSAGLWALEGVNGRVSSLLKVGGRTISNIFWNHLFKEFQEIRQFQVVDRKEAGLAFLFNGTGFSVERETRLRGILAEFLGPVPVEFLWVERIPLTPAGKLLQVVQD